MNRWIFLIISKNRYSRLKCLASDAKVGTNTSAGKKVEVSKTFLQASDLLGKLVRDKRNDIYGTQGSDNKSIPSCREYCAC